MSERKVLTKYYPPDFDPSALEKRQRGPKTGGPKLMTVRLMAPFSMKCTACGEFIYKGRKFNARKETTDMKYYNIPIYRFHIKCTRCSGAIAFRTDPKNMDYECEQGAKRNFEPWREAKLAEETEEERLDRLEREDAERDVMKDLENKTLDTKTEMAISDALDSIRTRNARQERAGKDGREAIVANLVDEEKERQDREDEEIARKAFQMNVEDLYEEVVDDASSSGVSSMDGIEKSNGNADPKPSTVASMPPPSFKRVVKKKKDHAAALGIKKKPQQQGIGR